MKKVFLDCETTGLDPVKNQILTLAIVIDQDGEEIESCEWKIAVMPWASIEARALQVNGIDLEVHSIGAQTEVQVITAIKRLMEKHRIYRPMLHGHNISFDLAFLKRMYARNNAPWPFEYHFQDTMILAMALNDAGKTRFVNYKLGTICEHYGIKAEFHRALDDTAATAKVYRRLLAEIKPIEVKP